MLFSAFHGLPLFSIKEGTHTRLSLCIWSNGLECLKLKEKESRMYRVINSSYKSELPDSPFRQMEVRIPEELTEKGRLRAGHYLLVLSSKLRYLNYGTKRKGDSSRKSKTKDKGKRDQYRLNLKVEKGSKNAYSWVDDRFKIQRASDPQ